MTKFMVTALLLFLCLSGCASNTITQDQLIGAWQSENFDESIRNYELAAELYFTDDGYQFVRISFDTTAGIITRTYPFRYEMKNNSVDFTSIYLEPYSLATLPPIKVKMTIRADTIVLKIDNKSVRLNKISDTVPYGYTDVDRKEIDENKQRIRQEILSFADDLSEIWGVPVVETQDTVFYGADWITHGVQFMAGDIGICITSRDVATEDYRPHVIVPAGEMSMAIPCVIIGDFAFVCHPDNPFPEDWLDAVSALYPES